jgi:hypothetical protein
MWVLTMSNALTESITITSAELEGMRFWRCLKPCLHSSVFETPPNGDRPAPTTNPDYPRDYVVDV